MESKVVQVDSKSISNEWLEIKKLALKYSSFAKYRKIILSYINPFFDQVDVNELDEITIVNYFAENMNLSSSTLNSIKYIMRSIFKYGEQKYKLKHVDFSYVKIQSNQETCITLTSEEYMQLSTYCFNKCNISTVAISIGLYAGLRLGEICALQWRDIDLENGIITVNKTVQRVDSDEEGATKTKLMIFPPKTSSSKRMVVIPDFLTEYLSGFARISNITEKNLDDYILSKKGNLVDPRNIQRRFKNVCKKLGFTTNFHILRHTFATNCIGQDIDVKTVSELLGHSNISTTLNRYVHPSLEHKKSQINKLKKPKMS